MSTTIKSQEAGLKVIEKIMSNFKKSQGQIKAHFIMSGESGSGKSWILEKCARDAGIPLVNINAAQLTREGISGNSLSKALEPLKKYNNKGVIVLLDEFDKLFNGVNGGTGDERSGVQSEILHIISSGQAQLIGDYGHYQEISTRYVLFAFAGAFLGEQSLSPDKLLHMGMFPELLGRVNLHVHLPSIECDELIAAMEKDPLLIHYFNLHQIKTKEDADEIKSKIAEQIRLNFERNVIGYRLIQRLIHQYFLFDGVFPEYATDPEFEAVKEAEEFEKQLSFGE